MQYLKAKARYVSFAAIDLKLALVYLRDGFDNGTYIPTTTAIEPTEEVDIALTDMNKVVPVGATVKFGATDEKEYTVTARTVAGGTNEVQEVQIDDDVASGTFTLSYGASETGNIAYNASAAVVQAALEGLDTIAQSAVAVTGATPTWTVTFQGALANTNVAMLVGNGSLLGAEGVTTDVIISETVKGIPSEAEVQTLTITGTPDSGTFQLGYGGDTTAAIDFDATAADVELALEALDSIPQDEATCSGGGFPGTPVVVTFSGTLDNADLAMITLEDNSLGGGAAPDLGVVETNKGVAPVNEQQTVKINSSVTGGTFTLTYSGQTTTAIAYNASAAIVEAALEALSNIDAGEATTSGGPGPGADWLVVFSGALAETDLAAVTGTGTSLTGGVIKEVSIREVTQGVVANSTSLITVSPALEVATTAGGTVTFDGRKLEIKIGEGNLVYSESVNRDYKLNRGTLDTVRDGDEVPMDVSFEFTWEFIKAVTASSAPTIEDVLKNRGEASEWETSSSDPCEPFCIDVEVHYDPGCGGDNNEKIVLAQFRYEKLDHNTKDAQISCTGKCNVTEATSERGAF